MADLGDVPFSQRPIGPMDVVGRDELGQPTYRNRLTGAMFGLQPEQPVTAEEYIALVNAIEGGENAVTAAGRPALGQQAQNALAGILSGVTAPARAARGEPVTYGDAWATALDYGVLGAPMAAPEGALRAGSFRAYHGSPHTFDRFDSSRIGTGEGAQAYGHGLYFADSEDVARSYRDSLARTVQTDSPASIATAQAQTRGGRQQAIDFMEDQIAAELRKSSPDEVWIAHYQPALDYLRSDRPLGQQAGSMYEVQIHANPEAFLDWDAPLSQQPEVLQDLARRADLSHLTGRQRRQIEAWRGEYTPPDGLVVDEPTGNILHSALTDYGDNPVENAALTARLQREGIPGIRYLDGGSRSAGQGSRNYVVFDDSIIEIIRRYGIAAAAPMLGMTAAQLQSEMDAQGVTE